MSWNTTVGRTFQTVDAYHRSDVHVGKPMNVHIFYFNFSFFSRGSNEKTIEIWSKDSASRKKSNLKQGACILSKFSDVARSVNGIDVKLEKQTIVDVEGSLFLFGFDKKL